MLIIDGHNLIPCVPGLSLESIDDEMELVRMLQVYARLKRRQIVVFFDGAPLGQAGSRTYGTIRAHFVPYGSTADDAIRRHLENLKTEARKATVVSGDRMVRANAVELRAAVISSDQFARDLLSTVTAAGMGSDFRSPSAADRSPGPAGTLAAKTPAAKTPAAKPPEAKKPPAAGKSPGADHLEEWYEMFGIDPGEAEKPIEPPPGQRRRAPRWQPSPPGQPPTGKKKNSRR